MNIAHANPALIRQRACVAAYTLGGSLIVILQRFLTFSYDSFTINACRFLAGALTLLAIVVVFRRAALADVLRRPAQLRNIAILSLLGFAPQALIVEGIARVPAVVAGLIGLLGLPLSIGLAVAIFPDERRAVRGTGFVIGSVLALGATIGLTLSQQDSTVEYSTGVVYMLLATLIGVLSILLTKRLVITSDPLCVSSLNTGISSVLFFVAALVWGDLSSVATAPPVNTLILFGSGAYGLLIGGALYMVIVRQAGIVIARFADLAMPVFTGLFGMILFQETLSPAQMAFGAALLLGCGLILFQRGSTAL